MALLPSSPSTAPGGPYVLTGNAAGHQVRVQLQQAQSQLANNARSVVLQGLAGLVVVAGAVATWWQLHISREGQITERFTKAVDQLGSASVDVRIGGIYALERIARNSAADRNAVLYLIGAFIRTRASWPVGAPDGPQHPTAAVDEHLPWMRVRAPEIQAAMGTLGRLPRSRDEPVTSLSRVDLRSIGLRDSRLSGSRFRYANLARWSPALEPVDETWCRLRHLSVHREQLITEAGSSPTGSEASWDSRSASRSAYASVSIMKSWFHGGWVLAREKEAMSWATRLILAWLS